ncbi:hypothetical protein D9M71_281430 [compost metagenome]
MSRAPSPSPSCLRASAACREPPDTRSAAAKARDRGFRGNMDGLLSLEVSEPLRPNRAVRRAAWRAVTASARFCSVVRRRKSRHGGLPCDGTYSFCRSGPCPRPVAISRAWPAPTAALRIADARSRCVEFGRRSALAEMSGNQTREIGDDEEYRGHDDDDTCLPNFSRLLSGHGLPAFLVVGCGPVRDYGPAEGESHALALGFMAAPAKPGGGIKRLQARV